MRAHLLLKSVVLGATVALVVPAVASAAPVAKPVSASHPLTVVTLQFDDGRGERSADIDGKTYNLRDMLKKNGLHATFFVNSGHTVEPGKDYWRTNGDNFSWDELKQLQADGNEIAGHTVDHPFLTSLTPTEQKREICRDRSTLLAHGLKVQNFAYPYGDLDAATEKAVEACGYNTGRGVTGLWGTGCESGPFADPGNCPYAEKLSNWPDRWNLRTEEAPTANFYLWNLQRDVEAAEQHGGGWVQIFFHRFCDWCDDYSTNPLVLDAFMKWLKPRAATNNTVVKTTAEVVGGPLNPAVAPPAVAGPGANLIRNGNLETAGAPAQCIDAPDFQQAPGVTGKGLATTAALDPDKVTRVRTPLDQGACAPQVTPGQKLTFSVAYKSSGSPLLQTWYEETAGAWVPWVTGAHLAPSADWKTATWALPPVPAGAIAVSVGVGLAGEGGTLAVDDLTLKK